MDAASGFVRSQLQDSRKRRSAFESEVTPRYDAKIVNILASDCTAQALPISRGSSSKAPQLIQKAWRKGSGTPLACCSYGRQMTN